MYQIKLLTQRKWSIQITHMKKRYEERYGNCPTYNRFKKTYETDDIFCSICGKSLRDHIGQQIVFNTRSGVTKWNHIECAIEKNIISPEWIAVVDLVNTSEIEVPT